MGLRQVRRISLAWSVSPGQQKARRVSTGPVIQGIYGSSSPVLPALRVGLGSGDTRRRLKRDASHFVVRREPSPASFIWIVGRVCLIALWTPKGRIGYASAPNSAESCHIGSWYIGRLRRGLSNSGFFAGVPGNNGPTNGLHARRLPALRRADTRCQSDRRVFAAEYPAALRALPRGVQFKCQLECRRSSAGHASASRAETAGFPITASYVRIGPRLRADRVIRTRP
jgi:hypothetical protein